MRDDNLSEALQVALKAAREAGGTIMGLYGKDYLVEEKAEGQPVTAADFEANQTIEKIILGNYPGDGWLSEESRDDASRLEKSRTWVIDPIDGTKEFIECVPQFSISIALVVDGTVALGVVYNPAAEELFAAVRARGATLNGSTIKVSDRKDPAGARLMVSRTEPRSKFAPFEDRYLLDPVGSIAYRLALVAAGQGDGAITFRSIHEWDVCAGVMIVEEAGGVAMDGEGESLRFNQSEPLFRGLVASNRELAPAIQQVMAPQLERSR